VVELNAAISEITTPTLLFSSIANRFMIFGLVNNISKPTPATGIELGGSVATKTENSKNIKKTNHNLP
jgi:hypothetical protein